MEIEYKYKNGIPFRVEIRENKVWLNASKVAETFGIDKSPNFWVRRRKTREFIDMTSRQMNCNAGKLVRETKGKSGSREIWLEAFVALEYLRWLQTDMAWWFTGKMNELIRDGTVSCE